MDVRRLAHLWFDELRAGDMRAAWAAMTENYRRCGAQSVTMTMHRQGEPVEELVEELSRPVLDDSAMSEQFLAAVRVSLLDVVGADILGLDVMPASRARPLSPGLELVPLVVVDDAHEGEHGLEIPAGASVRAVRVLVEDGDKIAGLDYLMAPGWPPTVAFVPATDE